MTWRSLSNYWEEMGGDPELELVDDELLQRQQECSLEQKDGGKTVAENHQLPF